MGCPPQESTTFKPAAQMGRTTPPLQPPPPTNKRPPVVTRRAQGGGRPHQQLPAQPQSQNSLGPRRATVTVRRPLLKTVQRRHRLTIASREAQEAQEEEKTMKEKRLVET